MKSVFVWNPKGGVGKSTTTVHLATLAELRGDGPVLISDADSQGSTADWFNTRRDLKLKGPGWAALTVNHLKEQIAALDGQGYKYLFIDGRAHLHETDADILACVDRVLIPLNPKPVDLKELRKTLPTVVKSGKPFSFLLSRCRHNLRTNGTTSVALSVAGPVMRTLAYEREIISDTFSHGMTVFELEQGGAAATEMRAIWQEFKEQLDGTN